MSEIRLYTLNGGTITKEIDSETVELQILAGLRVATVHIGKARLIDEIRKYGIKVYIQKNGARQLWDWRAVAERLEQEGLK